MREMRLFLGLNAQFDPVLVNVTSTVLLLFISWLDYITGYELGFFVFYFIPVSISAWYSGRRSGLAMSVASAVCWLLSDMLSHHPYSRSFFVYWEMFMRFVSFLTTALTVSQIKKMRLHQERLNGDLQRALNEVTELKACVGRYESCDRLEMDNARGEHEP